MVYQYKKVIFILLVLWIATGRAQQKVRSPFLVRTVVSLNPENIEQSWFLYSDKGFIITRTDDLSRKHYLSEKILEVSVKKNGVCLNGVLFSCDQVMIDALDGLLTLQGKSYDGSLLVGQRDKKKYAVLYTTVERYRRTTLCMDDLFTTKTVLSDSDTEQQGIKQVPEASTVYTVRVLLDQRDLVNNECWNFFSEKGFIITDPQHMTKKLYCRASDLMVQVKDGYFYLNNKKFLRKQAYITPVDDCFAYNNNFYQGSLLITHSSNSALLINCLELEDYICSVLRTESWPGWPLEVNKVFAIASRSYVIAMIREAKRVKRLYHVRNTNVHQTYSGLHGIAYLKDAVQQTKGVFLSYDNKPIVAMFDCCCGGVIPAHIADVDFIKAPYLARDYACTHCKPCKIYNWQVAYCKADFERIMCDSLPDVKTLKEIKVTKKDAAGLVQEIMLKHLRSTESLTGKKLYSLFKDIKSFCFSVRKKSDSIVFQGRGYGHHLGLCQWGAREMVRGGWDYKRILQFYYPGVQFMRLQ